MKSIIVGFSLSLCFAAEASAQSAAPLGVAVGQRVRVEAPSVFPEKRKGSVLSPVADTLFLRDREAILPVPVTGITGLEVSRGRNRLLWGFLGATAGFFAGGFIGGQSSSAQSGEIDGIIDVVGGVIVGTVSGAVIGAIAAPERWRRIYSR